VNPDWAVTGRKARACDLHKQKAFAAIPGEKPTCEWEADYIVVGTGAGGAPPLRILSDDPRISVIGFEAGFNAEKDPNVYDPFKNRQAANVQTSTYDWQMKTAFVTPLGKPLDISIGRMLGGATSHNGMMYMRPSQAYFNTWSLYGRKNWTAAEINAAYQRMENHALQLPTRGVGGPVDIKRSAVGPTSGSGAFVAKITNWTSEIVGLPILNDFNGANSPSYGPFYRFDLFVTPDGKRENSARAFLDDVINPDGTSKGNRKLRILFNSTVTRVLFDRNRRARGVEYIYQGRTMRAWAKKRIIIAANLFSTQILQNSGIGDASRLQALGIPVVYNNPNVGKHLSNHPLVSIPFTVNPNDAPTSFPDHSGICSGMFLPQWHANGTFNPADLSGQRKFQVFWLWTGGNNFAAATILQTPKSLGTEYIQSSDPLQVPLHDERMFVDHPEDLDDLVNFLYYFYQQSYLPFIKSQDPRYDSGW
jgi:choline dehydrogenase